MDDVRWEKLAAATGIAFVAIAVAGTLLFPPQNSFKDGVDYVLQHHRSVQLADSLGAFAPLLFLWFAGSLRSHLRSFEPETSRLSNVAFGAGVLTSAAALVAGALGAAANFDIAHLQNTAGRALIDASSGIFAFAIWPAIAGMVLATSISAMRTGAFPKAWAYVGGVGTLIFLVAPWIARAGEPDTSNPFGLISFLTFLIWTLVTSILLISRVGKAQSA